MTGTSRPTATIRGWGALAPPGEKRASIPGGATRTWAGAKRSRSTISALEDSDSVTIEVDRYRGGAMRCSSAFPREANRRESTICHISAWTWCRKTTRGRRLHSGVRNGMPFQISTTASPVPIWPENPPKAVEAKTA